MGSGNHVGHLDLRSGVGPVPVSKLFDMRVLRIYEPRNIIKIWSRYLPAAWLIEDPFSRKCVHR